MNMAFKRKGGGLDSQKPSKASKPSDRDYLSEEIKLLQKKDFDPHLDMRKKICKLCNQTLDVTKSSNVKRHFDSRHKEIVSNLFKIYKEKEEAEKKSKMTNHVTQTHKATDELVNLFSSAPVSMCLIENEHLQNLLSYIPNFKPPKTQKLRSLMVQKLKNIMNYVKENCAGNRYAVETDCGTTAGMLYSYLAVSIHFIDKKRKALTAVSFEMKELKDRHTSAFLRDTLEKALKDAGIDPNLISKVVTDGAKNMIKAFFEPFKISKDENGNDIIESNEDDEHQKLLDAYETFLLNGEDVEEFQFLMDDFEDLEYAGNFHCVGHRIQLVFKDVFDVAELLGVRKKVFKTISHFARSHQASAELYERTKKRLLFPAITRWCTLATTYERVLELKDDINIIALQNGWPTLTKNTVTAMENILLLTKDLTDFTSTIQSDSRPTISLLYPALHNVKTNLQESKKNVKVHPSIDFEEVIDDLIVAIDRRFDDILSTLNEDGDPLFAAATLLDSTTADLFPNIEELTLEQTKKTFYALSKKLNIEDDENENSEIPSMSTRLVKNPLGFAIQRPSTQLASTKTKTFGKEITEFYEAVKTGNWNFDNPIQAWFLHQNQYPKLFEIAMAVLAIPATSAAVERMFSQLKIHTDRHKNRSKTQLTRLRVLLSCNKTLYKKLVLEKIL